MARMNNKGKRQQRSVSFFIYRAGIAIVLACNHLQFSGIVCNSSLDLSDILTVQNNKFFFEVMRIGR